MWAKVRAGGLPENQEADLQAVDAITIHPSDSQQFNKLFISIFFLTLTFCWIKYG
jgi:hypothetical protein